MTGQGRSVTVMPCRRHQDVLRRALTGFANAVLSPSVAVRTFSRTLVRHGTAVRRSPRRAFCAAFIVRLSGFTRVDGWQRVQSRLPLQAIGFDDGAAFVSCRVVWTDDRGDRIFSAHPTATRLTNGRRCDRHDHRRFRPLRSRHRARNQLTWQYLAPATEDRQPSRAGSGRISGTRPPELGARDHPFLGVDRESAARDRWRLRWGSGSSPSPKA